MSKSKLSEKRFAELSQLFATAPVGLCLLDRDLRFVWINERLAAINGAPVSAHVGKALKEIIPEIADHVEPIYRRVIESGEPELDFEVQGFTPADPEKRYWIVSYYPYKVDGSVQGVNTAVQDITQLKLLEKALVASEQKFRTICETAPVMIRASDKRGQCVFTNREMERRLGWSSEELMAAEDLLSLCYPDARERAKVWESIQRADGKFREYSVRVKEGSTRIQMWADFRLSDQTQISLGYDVTDQREMENRLKEYNLKLEQLVEQRTTELKKVEEQKREIEKLVATGRVAATIAHEINNPLAGIKNGLYLLRDAIRRDHKHYHYFERIERELNRIAEIVREVYQIYQPAYQQPSIFEVASAVNEVCEMLKPMAGRREVEIRAKFASNLPTVVLPLGYLKQVLYNLLINAIEASNKPSSIEVSSFTEGGDLLIQVRDRGAGIAPEIQSKIFDPFFSTKDRSDNKLGLGLSVSKNLVALMGGKIDFKTESGQGSTFIVSLPSTTST